jgi:hypothetical protein
MDRSIATSEGKSIAQKMDGRLNCFASNLSVLIAARSSKYKLRRKVCNPGVLTGVVNSASDPGNRCEVGQVVDGVTNGVWSAAGESTTCVEIPSVKVRLNRLPTYVRRFSGLFFVRRLLGFKEREASSTAGSNSIQK